MGAGGGRWCAALRAAQRPGGCCRRAGGVWAAGGPGRGAGLRAGAGRGPCPVAPAAPGLPGPRGAPGRGGRHPGGGVRSRRTCRVGSQISVLWARATTLTAPGGGVGARPRPGPGRVGGGAALWVGLCPWAVLLPGPAGPSRSREGGGGGGGNAGPGPGRGRGPPGHGLSRPRSPPRIGLVPVLAAPLPVGAAGPPPAPRSAAGGRARARPC